MYVRLSDQKKEFIQGWIACRNWKNGEAHPDAPYEYGYTQKENDQYFKWREGFSFHLNGFDRGGYIDDVEDEEFVHLQLGLFD